MLRRVGLHLKSHIVWKGSEVSPTLTNVWTGTATASTLHFVDMP